MSDRDAPPGWREALTESDADLASGRTVPLETVQAGLRQAIARVGAKLAESLDPAPYER